MQRLPNWLLTAIIIACAALAAAGVILPLFLR